MRGAPEGNAQQNYSLLDPVALRGMDLLLQAKSAKYIFHHPHDVRLLIKVMRVDAKNKSWGMKRFYKSMRRSGTHTDLLRQVTEYFLVSVNSPVPPRCLSRIFGLIETDMGPGLVVEKITSADGTPAIPMKEILQRGPLSDALKDKLHQFMDDLSRHEVVLNDLGLRNMVLATEPSGESRFVLIDGFGERALIPLCSMSRSFNRFNTRRKLRKLRWRCGMSNDPARVAARKSPERGEAWSPRK
jgi:hypothetical protein